MSTARSRARSGPSPSPSHTRAAAPSETVGDLLKRLGNIPASRVRLHPAPGTATEKDVTRALDREGVPCELVEGTLVEKAMGLKESGLASLLNLYVYAFVVQHNLGRVTGEAGTVKLVSGLVRIPDVAFISWARLPSGDLPEEPVPELAPDLAVEVLSKGNTKAEMRRKLEEYFRAGVRLVWLVDAKARTVRVHTSPTAWTLLEEGAKLEGGDVLPGFELPLEKLFTPPRPPAAPGR